MPEKSEKSDAKANEKAKAKTKKQPDEDNKTTDLSVGEILRRARVSEDLTLDQVEEHIRIRASMLQAIEEMDLDKIPGWIYTVGFIRSYSEFLDLDGDKMIDLLKSQVGDHKREELNFPVTASESSLPDPWIIGMAAIGLIILIVTVFAIQNFRLPNSTDEEITGIPPVPVLASKPDEGETPARNTVNNEEEQNPDATYLVAELARADISRDDNGVMLPKPKPAPPNRDQNVTALSDYRIIIDVVDESWVEIRNSEGETLVSRVLKRGDQYYVPQDAVGLTMTTGNVAGIKLTVDGEVISIEGKKGDIKRNIPLDAQSLKEMYP